MLRPVLAAGAAVLALTATGCGLRNAALGSVSPIGTDTVLTSALGPGDPSAAPAAACSHTRAYAGLVALTSADTQTSVRSIVDRLRQGTSLETIAGDKEATVKQQANDAAKVLLDLAVANGKLSSSQEPPAQQKISAAIDTALAADVSSCIPAGVGATPAAALPTAAA